MIKDCTMNAIDLMIDACSEDTIDLSTITNNYVSVGFSLFVYLFLQSDTS